MITLQNVTKRYYSLVAVDDVSFTVPRGEVVGLLGPNGAGKTTLFKLIGGFLNPDSGVIRANGDGWPRIGFKPERLLFPNQMRVRDYLRMTAALSALPGRQLKAAVDQTLAQVGMTGAAGKRISDCSRGMRQRLMLAQSLLGRPPLLLLDEPTDGLDPEGQADIAQIIGELHATGHTILLSSHQLQEVTRICTYLVILKQGQIHYQGTMREALALRPQVTITAADDLAPVLSMLKTLHPHIEVTENIVVLQEDAVRLRRYVLSLLVGTGFDVVRVEQKRTTLEELYAEAVQWHDGSSH
ncbi:MAG: ABC transporter ATP-binding protein [Candidatus Promineifilaceae bacterium]|nr:ABC transporter ATP-binding protein [Candidatus Promineifilaceae bacterium]